MLGIRLLNTEPAVAVGRAPVQRRRAPLLIESVVTPIPGLWVRGATADFRRHSRPGTRVMMKRASIYRALVLVLLTCATSAGVVAQTNKYARDPKQLVDEEYTKKIKEYTTEPFFLVAAGRLPAGVEDGAHAEGRAGRHRRRTRQAAVYGRGARVHADAREGRPGRVKVFSIGKSEEGREMIAVAIAAEPVLAKLDENRARLAKLADPRTIKLDDAEADRLVKLSVPVYYIAGALHSHETGAPTSLMELAYRLTVDESPYIKAIRNNVITMITPVLETDGRDRQVDVYKWHLANPKDSWPPVAYWGKYVMHDNNRDAMAATLALTRNVINFVVAQKVQVLHDLHESVPYLYDNTVGDGPYNAWVDPILTDEWQLLGWNNMSEMTKFGMPGAFAHGTFDTWSPGYLMFIGAMHNGISRLYETFGNAGADTVERKLQPNDYARTWYKQNPPLPKAMWSQRNNNNYTQTGLLTALSYFADNNKLFLKNFYLKSKRSILKPTVEGPAAYVLTADDAETWRAGRDAARAPAAGHRDLARDGALHGDAAGEEGEAGRQAGREARRGGGEAAAEAQEAGREARGEAEDGDEDVPGRQLHHPHGPALQPHRGRAAGLPGTWSPNDPQKRPYDDTGGPSASCSTCRWCAWPTRRCSTRPWSGSPRSPCRWTSRGRARSSSSTTTPTPRCWRSGTG